jgi:23S rRNA (cytidine1920-2'-O)/16S rRNA (cytidine1409-2'-O)-methyltransferase
VIITQAGYRPFLQATVHLKAVKRFVSRGGDKLEGALERFGFAVDGLRCVDIGASSGGFSHCLLTRGAQSVTAVDVGYGQFDWRLRNDPRIHLWERANFAHIKPQLLGAPFDLAVVDLSFTPLARHSCALAALLGQPGHLIALIKPQFEVPQPAASGGVVCQSAVHVQAIVAVLESLREADLAPQALTYSQPGGQKGNREFFVWAQHCGLPATIDAQQFISGI